MGWHVDDVKTFSLLDTFKIAFASALPLHVVDLVLQAIDLSLGEDKDKSLEYFTAKVELDGICYETSDICISELSHLEFSAF